MFLTKSEFDNFGADYGGHRGYTFVTSPSGGNVVENASSVDEMGQLLGRQFPDGEDIIRIDITDLKPHKPRMPFAGNKNWIPGGFTSGGIPERIINPIDLRGNPWRVIAR